MFRRSRKILKTKCLVPGLIVGLVGVNQSSALDEERLWLPTNYERVYLDLKASAEKAEALDRCVKVLRGTIDLQKSTPEHPIFRIQCRQENGRTYNEMVDGLTKETLTTVQVVEVPLTEEELEAKRLEEEKQRLAELESRKNEFLSSCLGTLREKTRLFKDVEILNTAPEPLEFDMESALFKFQFDAKDIHDVSLAYQAVCSVEAGMAPSIKIKGRRE